MNSRLRKLLLPLLRAVKEGRPISFRMRSAASQSLFLIGKGTSKQRGPSARLKRSTEKRKSQAAKKLTVHEAVMKRAFYCEACDDRETVWEVLQPDHWLGGSGRRIPKQSVENCWALCMTCHRDRTENRPDAAYWNAKFAAHAVKYGYPVIEHIVHEPIARKAQ